MARDISFEAGMIEDKVREFYDRRINTGGYDFDLGIEVTHRNMNWYDVKASYVDPKYGTVTAHYVVLIRDGRVEFQ